MSKIQASSRWYLFSSGESSIQPVPNKASRKWARIMHWTLGILRKSQTVSYALAFFWSDGFAVPSLSAGNAHRWTGQTRQSSSDG